MGSVYGQLAVDGLVMGLVFVILATGLVLIMSVSRILFMAYGVFYTIGAYGTWYAVNSFHLPYFAALAVGVACAGALGALSYILIFKRLQRSEGGFLATLIAAMGLSMVLTQGGLLLYGTVPRGLPPIITGKLEFLGIIVSIDKILLVAMGVGVTLFLFWMYEKTAIGRQMRAVAFIPEAAALQGVNVTMIYLIVMGLGCALAGFAGGIIAPSYGMNANMGGSILWTVMLMCMLGGIDSLLGAVMGGLIIGQILSFGTYFMGSTVQIILFFFIGIVLYFKPNGLLGRGVDIGI